MRRTRIHGDPEASRARLALEAYLREHAISQSELGRLAGVPQPQVNRFLSGRTKSITDDVEKLCRYAKIDPKRGIGSLKDNAPIAQAVSSVWDGTEQSAEVLAELIRALGPLMTIAVRRVSPRERKRK